MRRLHVATGLAFAVAFVLGALLVYPGGPANAARFLEDAAPVTLSIENTGDTPLATTVRFQDPSGRLVLEETFVSPAGRTLEKRIVNLPPGTYRLQALFVGPGGGRSDILHSFDTSDCGDEAVRVALRVEETPSGVSFPRGGPVTQCA